MKQFAIIGLGKFGRRIIDELAEAGCELLVIDRDAAAVDEYKDRVAACYVADAISEDVVTRLVPPGLDAAILDLGSNIEAAILATKYLKQLGIARIVAKVESDQHAEILELVGATDIIRANLEAARRVAPLLLSSMLFSYLPIGKDFVIAELKVPADFIDLSLVEANLRQAYRLNVIALKIAPGTEYTYFDPTYRLKAEDVMLVAAKEDDLDSFARERPLGRTGIPGVFSRLFSRIKRS
jgi:trk system potassium uptake protein TrkA